LRCFNIPDPINLRDSYQMVFPDNQEIVPDF